MGLDLLRPKTTNLSGHSFFAIIFEIYMPQYAALFPCFRKCEKQRIRHFNNWQTGTCGYAALAKYKIGIQLYYFYSLSVWQLQYK
jgi:hypothetical protein